MDGTQRFELPVSRITLKVCGGVPMDSSEKSIISQSLWWQQLYLDQVRRTLSVEEVADRHGVVASISVDCSVLEHLLCVAFWADAHVFLA